jgi:P4 family phage/plasmid primase-like protien
MPEEQSGPSMLAHFYLEKNRLINWRDDFYRWDGRVWVKMSDKALGHMLLQFAPPLAQALVDGRTITDTIRLLEYLVAEDDDVAAPFHLDTSEPVNALIFLNGMLLVDRFVRNEPDSFVTTDPNVFATALIPYSFDPAAICPEWLQFLDWFVDSDEKVAAVLQDFAGLCLLPELRLEVMLMLLGDGANGKSVFASVLRRVLVDVSNVPLDRFTGRFDLGRVAGRLNVCDEPSRNDRIIEGALKRFISQEPFEIDRKYKQQRTVTPTARLLVVTNCFPYTGDRSDGFWRRLRLVRCSSVVEQKDVGLIDKLMVEASGIMNWVLAGAVRVWQNKAIYEAPAVVEAVAEERLMENPVAQFLLEHFELGEGCFPFQGLFTAFNQWRISHGVRDRSSSTFVRDARQVLRTYPQFKGCEPDARFRVDGERQYGVTGIKKRPTTAGGTTRQVIDLMANQSKDEAVLLAELRKRQRELDQAKEAVKKYQKLEERGQIQTLVEALEVIEDKKRRAENQVQSILAAVRSEQSELPAADANP